MAEDSPDDGGSSGRGGAGGDVNTSGENDPRTKAATRKGKSCKGCLYYSSTLKSNARNPVCVGIARTLPQVPKFIVGESESEATKEGRNMSDFKYTCVGYSVFLDNKDKHIDEGENQSQLPFCAGIELLVDRRPSTAGHVPASVHREDGAVRRQPPSQQPAQISGDEFYNRFKRNAGLVASGVARNLYKAGNHVKELVDDILYPYRRRPK